MTEDQIERKVERYIDHLDRIFMSGRMTQEDYDKGILEIQEWAANAHHERRLSNERFTG